MKVKELKELLEKADDNMEVCIVSSPSTGVTELLDTYKTEQISLQRLAERGLCLGAASKDFCGPKIFWIYTSYVMTKF